MVSVTEFFKDFHEVIDWDSKAKKIAKKEGLSIEELKEEWEKDRLIGIDIHNQCIEEDVSKGALLYQRSNTSEEFDYTIINNKFEEGIFLERPIYLDKYKIIGIPDKTIVKGIKVTIIDNKSFKKLYRKSFTKLPNGISIPPKKFFYPIEHLDDCNYNESCLKLSMYAYLLWQNNKHLKIDKLYINHIIHNKGKIIKKELIQVPYMREEVEKLLKTIN